MDDFIATIGVGVMPEGEAYAKLCVESLLNQKYSESFEILLAQHPGYHYDISHQIPANITIVKVDSGESLSSKRNDILRHAKGKYILFIDDDAIADELWLYTMVKGAENFDADIFWGSIKPIFEKELPKFLLPFEIYIGGFHYNNQGRLCIKGLIGCNFGIRKGLDHSRGHFIETLGRGSEIRGGEEILYIKEYYGDKTQFIQGAVVYHHIQSHRINFKYILYNQLNNTLSRVFINKTIGVSNKKYGIVIFSGFMKSIIPQKNYLGYLALYLWKLMGYFKGIYKYVIAPKKEL